MKPLSQKKAEWHEDQMYNLKPTSEAYKFHAKRMAYWENKK